MKTEATKNSSAMPAQTPPQTKAEAQQLTHAEKEALKRYEKTRHISTLPHEDTHVPMERSTGEQIFNTVTYKGLGWLTNAAISVYVTDLFRYGAGKKYFNAMAKSFAEKYQHMSGASAEVAEKTSISAIMTIGLFSGGTSLLYPLKKLEDHKAAIVKWIDGKLNQLQKPNSEERELQERVHARLDADIKPSWGNVLLGRFLGTSAVIAVALGIAKGRDETTSKFLANKVSDAMVETTSPKLQEIGKSSRFRNMLSISMIEVYTSFIAEEVLYLTTRIYRSIHREKQENEVAHQAAKPNDAEPKLAQPTTTRANNFPTTTVAEPMISSHQPVATISVGA
jgi:hypothetical protein